LAVDKAVDGRVAEVVAAVGLYRTPTMFQQPPAINLLLSLGLVEQVALILGLAQEANHR